MTTEATLPVSEPITAREWQWVRGLIHEVTRHEDRETFAKELFQWDLAVIEFRKVELRRITLGTPTDDDLRFHSACLHSLLGVGHALIAKAHGFQPLEMSRFGVSHEQIAAYVEELERSFREWHHGFSEADLTHAREKIFGVTA